MVEENLELDHFIAHIDEARSHRGLGTGNDGEKKKEEREAAHRARTLAHSRGKKSARGIFRATTAVQRRFNRVPLHLPRRFFHPCILLLALLAVGPAVRATPQNILVLIADDYGVDSNSLYNTNPAASLPPTPRINALKQTGVLFRNAYANPECSPTRACMMTGRHAFRHGVGDAIASAADAQLKAAEFTLPDAFAANPALGYQLAQFGKYHLDLGPNTPNTIGGWPLFSGCIPGAVASYTSWTKTVNGTQTANYSVYATTDTANDAITWIQGHSAQPWFAWVAFNAPHTPLHKPPNSLAPHYTTLSGTAQDIAAHPRSYFEAMCEAEDTEIGRLLDSINLTNTTIIFLGDNGTTNLVIQPPFPNTRGKSTLYEGGIHVPLIIAGNAVVSPNRESTALVHAVDLYSTILDLAGISTAATVPGNITLDSHSLLPILRNTADGERTVYDEIFGSNVAAANVGRCVRNAQYKLIAFTGSGAQEFYDLTADPVETTNLLVGPLTAAQQQNLNCLTLKLAQFQTATAVPVVTTTALSSGQFTITIPRTATTGYALWRAADLACASWAPVGDAVIALGATTVQLTDPNATAGQFFYRVLATPQSPAPPAVRGKVRAR